MEDFQHGVGGEAVGQPHAKVGNLVQVSGVRHPGGVQVVLHTHDPVGADGGVGHPLADVGRQAADAVVLARGVGRHVAPVSRLAGVVVGPRQRVVEHERTPAHGGRSRIRNHTGGVDVVAENGESAGNEGLRDRAVGRGNRGKRRCDRVDLLAVFHADRRGGALAREQRLRGGLLARRIARRVRHPHGAEVRVSRAEQRDVVLAELHADHGAIAAEGHPFGRKRESPVDARGAHLNLVGPVECHRRRQPPRVANGRRGARHERRLVETVDVIADGHHAGCR